ncbi:MAG: hypothetical protein PHE27_02060 [Alphaproteobacteria bacterium]|nr:hypothetical protein [Alphaproteobacteria bacterium]
MRKIGSLFLLLALGACSSDGKPGVPPEPPAPEETEVSTANLICPQVAILRQAQETFDYGGSGPHAGELVFKAKLKTL